MEEVFLPFTVVEVDTVVPLLRLTTVPDAEELFTLAEGFLEEDLLEPVSDTEIETQVATFLPLRHCPESLPLSSLQSGHWGRRGALGAEIGRAHV